MPHQMPHQMPHHPLLCVCQGAQAPAQTLLAETAATTQWDPFSAPQAFPPRRGAQLAQMKSHVKKSTSGTPKAWVALAGGGSVPRGASSVLNPLTGPRHRTVQMASHVVSRGHAHATGARPDLWHHVRFLQKPSKRVRSSNVYRSRVYP